MIIIFKILMHERRVPQRRSQCIKIHYSNYLIATYLITRILIPLVRDVIRNFVLQTKGLEGLTMRQRLGLVLKVKTLEFNL